MKSIFAASLLTSLFILTIAGCVSQPAPSVSLAPPLPPAPPLPEISGRVFSIMDYGAVADGTTMNTDAINKAIQAASAAGGGRVVIPEGKFLSGPIVLLSNVELNTQAGAVVNFSRNIQDYPLILTNFEGLKAVRSQPPISAVGQRNIAITGAGTFDGGGETWRMLKRKACPPEVWEKAVASGGFVTPDLGEWLKSLHPKKPSDAAAADAEAVDAEANSGFDKPGAKPSINETWFPSIASMEGGSVVKMLQTGKDPDTIDQYEPWHIFLRPPLVELYSCNTVLLDGPTFRNSPGWNVHPIYTENLTVRNITIFNYIWAVNGDAIDIDACRNVYMHDCMLNAGDDGLCIKSGRDAEGRKVGKPTENVVITRCTVGTGHGGFVIGSEMSGGVRNVWCSDCTFEGTDVGLRFKTTRGRGGVVENVYVDNIRMSRIKGPAILFDMYYQIRSAKREVKKIDETTPRFRDMHVSNVTCDGAKQAIKLAGLPELPLENVSLENVKIINADTGITIDDVDRVTLRNVDVKARVGTPIKQGFNISDLTLDNVTASTTRPSAK